MEIEVQVETAKSNTSERMSAAMGRIPRADYIRSIRASSPADPHASVVAHFGKSQDGFCCVLLLPGDLPTGFGQAETQAAAFEAALADAGVSASRPIRGDEEMAGAVEAIASAPAVCARIADKRDELEAMIAWSRKRAKSA